MPPEYAALSNIQVLDLADNVLTGRIPAAYFSASAFSFNAFLYLYLNNLTGPLPAITPNCPLCAARLSVPGSGYEPGQGSGLILEPMRAGFGARSRLWPCRSFTRPSPLSRHQLDNKCQIRPTSKPYYPDSRCAQLPAAHPATRHVRVVQTRPGSELCPHRGARASGSGARRSISDRNSSACRPHMSLKTRE